MPVLTEETRKLKELIVTLKDAKLEIDELYRQARTKYRELAQGYKAISIAEEPQLLSDYDDKLDAAEARVLDYRTAFEDIEILIQEIETTLIS